MGKGGRDRFCILNFDIQILNFGFWISSFSLIEILLINQELCKKVVENRGHFPHTVLEPIYLILQKILSS